MIKTKRLDQIKKYIIKRNSVSLNELVDKFNVSKNTIRRDVQNIVDDGGFKKVYGGISVDKQSPTVPYVDRQVRNQKNKQTISKAAAHFIEDDDVIFIDSGTTTVEIINYIKDKDITIITNNIDFIVKALPYENLSVISMGGTVERKTNSFTSIDNDEIIHSYNISKAFLASTGLSLKNGVTNSLPLESSLKQRVVERSAETFLLVDHSKFDKVSLTTYSSFEAFDYIVTDKIPGNYRQYAKQNDIKVIIP